MQKKEKDVMRITNETIILKEKIDSTVVRAHAYMWPIQAGSMVHQSLSGVIPEQSEESLSTNGCGLKTKS